MPGPYFFDPVADLFEPISAALKAATGKESYFLEQSKNHAVERWDWMPTTGAAAGPETPGLDTTSGQRALCSIDFRCDIACRAKTVGGAWQMAQLFISASRKVKAASGVLEGWRIAETSDQPATQKNVVYLTMVWRRPLLELPLDAGTTPVVIKHVEFDTTSAPYGDDDGTLVAPQG